MKRPEVEEFKRLTDFPASTWGMADSDVVELCDYILQLEAALRDIANLTDVDADEAPELARRALS